MAESDFNIERFAHDVFVHVLEKFGIFKAPDDTRKQNKYVYYDFLPCISRSVVSYAIWIRDSFKNSLENNCETADSIDKEEMWNFLDEYFLENVKLEGRECSEKVCISLALCTEYIQFASFKDLPISLNNLVTRWNDFFEKHLKEGFEVEGGHLNLYARVKTCQVDELDDFHKAFISEYCLPYCANDCTTKLAQECIEKYGFNIHLENTIFGVKTMELSEIPTMFEGESITKDSEMSPNNSDRRDEPKPEFRTSDSESDDSCSAETCLEASRNGKGDSEIMQNTLLGIPPHEDTLREIDPFFIENIPSPPKPLLSKSPVHESGPSDASCSTSKAPERESGLSDVPPCSSAERESCPSYAALESSAEPEELKEMIEQILSNLEHDMDSLRALLFGHGLISMKSGRRGSRKRVKDSNSKMPPKGPEGLM